MDLLDQLLKTTPDASMDFDSIVEDYMMEDAVAAAELKAKHAGEMEKLKDTQEGELEALTDRHELEDSRQKDADTKETEDDAIKTKRDADRKSNEKANEGLLNFIDTWKQELDEVSASRRLTNRLKKSGVDLDKRAKDRAKEHAALVKKYGKKNESFELEEGKLVANVRDVLRVITKKIEIRLEKEYDKNAEKGIGMINTLGAMVGHKVTNDKQSDGKMFLKFGESAEDAEVEEERDYKKERENYGGRPEQMERNAARKRARRQMEKEGKAKAGDGKDVHHKDNNPLNNDKNNLSLVTQNYNRKEPRLRMKKLKERGVLPNVRK